MTTHRTAGRAEARITAWLDTVSRRRAGRGVPPPQVLVRAPGLEFGYGNVARPFHAASVGKVMTAVVIARLVEGGGLAFETPIGAVLPSADLAGLPGADGVDVGRDVTVEHLLNHTSGLPDYFDPPRGSQTGASVRTVAREADRHWTPAALLEEVRGLPAVGRPGERFHYSDTAYVLLGRIAEEVAAAPFEELLHTHVYAPGGMEHSSTPYSSARSAEDIEGLDIEPFWLRGHELSGALSLSLDWAGGGIVGPADDFVRFQEALHGGRLVSPGTLRRLSTPQHRMRRGIHYGAGMVTVRFGEFTPPLLRGLPEPVGGLGYFATHMFYYPAQDAHVVLNFHGYRWMNLSFRMHLQLARLIAQLRPDGPLR